MTTTTKVLATLAVILGPAAGAAQAPGAQPAANPSAISQPPAANAPGAANPPAVPAPPLVGPPIQRIESASAISTEQLGAVTSVRELRDGRILVNDGTRRRLILMDSTLTTLSVVLYSVSDVANTYVSPVAALLYMQQP